MVAEYLQESNQFAALSFDTVGTNDDYSIGDDDVLAVSFLDTPIRASAYREIVRAGGRITECLRDISLKLPLWDLEEGSKDYVNALSLWNLLEDIPGMGPTRVSKLMARKRPFLIPILDERVKEFFDHETQYFWLPLGHALKDERRQRAIRSLAPGVGISVLRILDIAIWTTQRAQNARLRSIPGTAR